VLKKPEAEVTAAISRIIKKGILVRDDDSTIRLKGQYIWTKNRKSLQIDLQDHKLIFSIQQPIEEDTFPYGKLKQ
jgi:hypothetical protein